MSGEVAWGSAVRGVIAGCALLLCACAADEPQRPTQHDAGSGEQQKLLPALCERDRGDSVRDVFCADEPPTVRSLEDLQEVLHMRPGASHHLEAMYGNFSFVTLLSHSTSLSGQRVSALNPRMIVIGED